MRKNESIIIHNDGSSHIRLIFWGGVKVWQARR